MVRSSRLHFVMLALSWTAMALAGTFGTVVPIGGHAADLALDEARGVLYIANFSANRIDVMSLSTQTVRTSMNVAPQPGSLALSPDGHYLLVAHFGNFSAPNSTNNALTLIDLNSSAKQTFALSSAPLGVAFGIDNKALISTTQDFELFDPVTGTVQVLDTVSGVAAKTLPVAPANFPPQVVTASVTASADGRTIIGLTDTFTFRYDVTSRTVQVIYYVSSPPMGPRVVSLGRDGVIQASGWAVINTRNGKFNQFTNVAGTLNIGSHAVDSSRGLIYAQIPEAPETTTPATPTTPTTPAAPTTPTTGTITPISSQPPVLRIYDADSLAVQEQLQLAENLAGKSVLSADNAAMYAISDSGVTVLPVGQLANARRLQATQQDVVFRGNSCNRQISTQEVLLVDASGANTNFALSTTMTGIRVSPSSGVTPATIRITIDPAAFQNLKGTFAGTINIKSTRAVNLPKAIRVLVNSKDPDQRGSFVNVPGKLVDILPDPARERFYVLRQDTNQVLVFDGTNFTQIAALKTGNTPTQLALTMDRRYLMVGHDNAQFASVYDLETLQESDPIIFPGSDYPRSIAASGSGIIAACRVAGPKNTIDRVDFATRRAVKFDSLGIYNNDIHVNTVLVPTPNGSSIMAVSADGNMMLYNQGNFTISRHDYSSLAGSYAASSYDQFIVGNVMFNSSLVTTKTLESGTGTSSGFVFIDDFAFRATAPGASAPGVMQRVDLESGSSIRATRIVEAPVTGDLANAFTRTIAPLYSRQALVLLTVSGFTALPWTYDAAVAPPRLERVVNAADGGAAVAPGGLVSIFGSQMSPVSLATSEMPLPTALADSCLLVNGQPMPMLFVSPSQINAQLPFTAEGNVTMVLRTPGGVSDNYNLRIAPGAPGVFRADVLGDGIGVPTIVRARNGELATPSNPLHRGDTFVVYLTGLGKTTPAVETGVPAPLDQLATVLTPVKLDISGADVPVAFAGLTPGQIGLYQINATVPRNAPVGLSVPLRITQGANSTTLTVRVVE